MRFRSRFASDCNNREATLVKNPIGLSVGSAADPLRRLRSNPVRHRKSFPKPFLDRTAVLRTKWMSSPRFMTADTMEKWLPDARFFMLLLSRRVFGDFFQLIGFVFPLEVSKAYRQGWKLPLHPPRRIGIV